ncbi:hypothetical protein HPY01_15065, partial [Lactobacillus rhamnosus]|nr:hypothetical protein [Lacticaseibacillus rhamnosus]
MKSHQRAYVQRLYATLKQSKRPTHQHYLYSPIVQYDIDGTKMVMKLVQSRHKVLLRVVFVFVILLAFLNLGGTIHGYQNRQEFMLSPSEFTAT